MYPAATRWSSSPICAMVMFWQVSRRLRTGFAILGSFPSGPGPSVHRVRLKGSALLSFGFDRDEGVGGDGPVFHVGLHLEAIVQESA